MELGAREAAESAAGGGRGLGAEGGSGAGEKAEGQAGQHFWADVRVLNWCFDGSWIGGRWSSVGMCWVL